jgi:DNA-binding MarR family transcriptional regulator
MFFLEELPSTQILKGFADRFPEMEIDSTSACLKLLWFASHLTRDLELHFTQHELSQARFLVLIILERSESKRLMPVEIARQLGISKKNTARVLSFMEEANLTTKASHDSDGRASLVSITAKGSKTLAQAMPGYYRILNRAMKKLNSKEKRSLIELLNQLNEGVLASS